MGDNGQGDQLAGKTMLDELPDQVAAVFIHNVTSTPPLIVAPWENIFLFDTYVDAASAAYAEGFIAEGSVLRVLEGALKSKQYQDCAACFPDEDTQTAKQKLKCALSDVQPKYDSVGSGCYSLFTALEQVADQTSYKLTLPLQRVFKEIVQEIKDEVSFVWWLICKVFQLTVLIVLTVVGVIAYQKYKPTKKPKSQ